MRKLSPLLAALILAAAGCASTGEAVLRAGTTGSVRFAPEDVDAAIVIAQNAKDAVAEACFRAIRRHVDAPPDPVTKGVVSAYAAARVAVRSSRAGLAEDVHVACSPLVVDAGTFATSLARTLRGVD
jgi:hypothetical protein